MADYLIVSTPVYVTLFWAIVFLSGNLFQNRARFMLGIFMIIAAILYSCHAVFFLEYREFYLTVDALYLFASLSVYPLYYWYIKLLTVENEFRINNLLHLLPALILSVLHEFLHIITSPSEQVRYFNEVLVENKWQLVVSTGNAAWLARVFFISRMVFAIQVIYCLILGYRLANKHNKRIDNFYSNLENRKLIWIKLLNITFLIASLSSTVFNLLGRGRFLDNNLSLIIPSAIFSSILFLIGIQGVKQNVTILDMEPDIHRESAVEALSEKSNALLKQRLNELMSRDRMYLIPDLRITTLSKILNTNRTYVSNLINEETGDNFNTFINRFRIDHAIKLMNQRGGSLLVIDFIAQESGFGSSSAFIRAFKAIKGVPPGKYLHTVIKG